MIRKVILMLMVLVFAFPISAIAQSESQGVNAGQTLYLPVAETKATCDGVLLVVDTLSSRGTKLLIQFFGLAEVQVIEKNGGYIAASSSWSGDNAFDNWCIPKENINCSDCYVRARAYTILPVGVYACFNAEQKDYPNRGITMRLENNGTATSWIGCGW